MCEESAELKSLKGRVSVPAPSEMICLVGFDASLSSVAINASIRLSRACVLVYVPNAALVQLDAATIPELTAPYLY